MKKKTCPNCKSEHIDILEVFGEECLICQDCGYDSSELLTDQSKGGKGKSRNVYRSGGGSRSR